MPAPGLILIPAYNEAQSLPGVLCRVRTAAQQLGLDVLVVDDGSRDATASLARAAGVKCVSHVYNEGYAVALQTGMKFALCYGYRFVAILDADGQHDPGEIAGLLEVQRREEADVVVGSRYLTGAGYRATAARRLGMLLFSRLSSWLTGLHITDSTSGFKVLSERAMAMLALESLGDFHSEALLFFSMSGLKIVEAPITVAERKAGRSMYSVAGSLYYPFKTLLLLLVVGLKTRLWRRQELRA